MNYKVTVNGEVFDVEVERTNGSKPVLGRPSPAPKPAVAQTPAPVASAPKAASVQTPAQAPASTDGASKLVCPMPGNAWKIVANVGDSVKAGQPVIILEAMKMEIEVTAEKDGTVSKMLVSAGQTVNTGDVLAEIA